METVQVILVDKNDQPVGFSGKTTAHEQGLLHRAFSVFIFNPAGEMLLQQRAQHKYHSGGLWTNACCSHPLPGEETLEAAQRRLEEELGFSVPVTKIFDFVYKAELENGLTEHEFDHVFTGEYTGPINFNKDEVMAVSYRGIKEIRESMRSDPGQYTAWFHLAFPGIADWWQKQYNNRVA
ncbi:MAG: isopentenyl-diphosphate Delta-isomerase [Chitinophagaceae bacterium]